MGEAVGSEVTKKERPTWEGCGLRIWVSQASPLSKKQGLGFKTAAFHRGLEGDP